MRIRGGEVFARCGGEDTRVEQRQKTLGFSQAATQGVGGASLDYGLYSTQPRVCAYAAVSQATRFENRVVRSVAL